MTDDAHARISHKGFDHILVICSGDQRDIDALHQAQVICAAARHDGGSLPTVSILSVVEPQPGEDFIRTLGGASADRLEELRCHERHDLVRQSLARVELPDTTRISVVPGKGFVEIVHYAEKMSVDLVIKPASPVGGLHAQIFGSTDLHLLRKCPCPVWVTRPFPEPGAAGAGDGSPLVVAAVDFDRDAQETGDGPQERLNNSIVETAISVAGACGASLMLVHAWQAPAEGLLLRAAPGVSSAQLSQYVRDVERWHHAALDTLADIVRHSAGERVSQVSATLLQGDADEVIADYVNSHRPIVLVMGTIGRTGIPGVIIGNTAEDILISIDGSVLAVKPPGFVSPLHVS